MEDAFDLDKIKLKDAIINDGIKWGTGINKIGKTPDWIIDSREILLHPDYSLIVAKLFLNKLEKFNVSYIGGLTLAAGFIVASIVTLSKIMNKNIKGFVIRREPKEDGLQKQIEGQFQENTEVVIVDDIIHSGDSVFKCINLVENRGCKVKGIITLINFKHSGYKKLLEKNYNVEYIFDLNDLMLESEQNIINKNFLSLIWIKGNINNGIYGAPKSTPKIDGDKIYLGSDKGKFYCFDLNGNLVWDFEVEDNERGIHSTPLLFQENVYFGAYDGYLYSLNKNNRNLIWKTRIGQWIGSSPQTDGKKLYVGIEYGLRGGSLCAFDIKSGKLLWNFKTKHYVASTPKISEKYNLIIFGSNDGLIYCVNDNGNLMWDYKTNGAVKGSFAIDNGKVYATSFDGNLYCLDIKTGKLIWNKKLGMRLYNTPLIITDKVVVGSYSKRVFALNKEEGKIKWMFITKDSVISSPIFYKGKIFIGCNDENLYVLKENDGSLMSHYKTNGYITSTPCVNENKVICSSNDGNLYYFKMNEQ